MNGVMRKPKRLVVSIREAMRIIRINGFIAREANGDLWVSTGETISRTVFKWLLDEGLIQPQGDSLFGGPSQTYIPTKDDHVSGHSASSPPLDPG